MLSEALHEELIQKKVVEMLLLFSFRTNISRVINLRYQIYN